MYEEYIVKTIGELMKLSTVEEQREIAKQLIKEALQYMNEDDCIAMAIYLLDSIS